MSDRTIASLIRKMFNGEEVSLDDLEEYYYYLHTKDMISFSEVYFNKAIKTTKTRLLKDDPGLTAYSLSDEKTFDITTETGFCRKRSFPEEECLFTARMCMKSLAGSTKKI